MKQKSFLHLFFLFLVSSESEQTVAELNTHIHTSCGHTDCVTILLTFVRFVLFPCCCNEKLKIILIFLRSSQWSVNPPVLFKQSNIMAESLPVRGGWEAWSPLKSNAAVHERTRSVSLLWFLLQWYSLTSCERLPSSLSYSHWCLSFEPQTPTPWTSLHLSPQWQLHWPVNLAVHPVSSNPPPLPPS